MVTKQTHICDYCYEEDAFRLCLKLVIGFYTRGETNEAVGKIAEFCSVSCLKDYIEDNEVFLHMSDRERRKEMSDQIGEGFSQTMAKYRRVNEEKGS